MSELTRNRPDSEDLSALVRRGQGSHADERALQTALERDPTLRVAHEVGLDIDRHTSVRAGDEDLIMRAADAALQRAAPVRRGSMLGERSWQMVAAMVALAV